jgi:hypothetical protein
LKGGYPLALISALIGKSSVELASQVVMQRNVIRTCVGTAEERKLALSYIRAAKERGAVLDTYTAWTAHSMGLLPVLKAFFRRVTIAQATLDELMQWRSRYEGPKDRPLMSVGYRNGEYLRMELTQEELAASRSTITSGIEALRKDLEALPTVAPEQLSEIESTLIDVAPHGVLEPVFVALSNSFLLLSEDMHLRNVAQELHHVPGGWLQAVLLVCLEEGVIDFEAYAEAVAGLAIRRHDYITLTSPVLLKIAQQDQSHSLEKLRAAASFMATPTADVGSHWPVLWEAVRGVWHTDLGELRRKRAAGIFLERVACLLTRIDRLREGFDQMLKSENISPMLHTYIAGWRKGHFIDN